MKVTFGRNTIAYKSCKRIPSIATASDQVVVNLVDFASFAGISICHLLLGQELFKHEKENWAS